MNQYDLSCLPAGPTPIPLEYPYFPSRAALFLWRNWEMIPLARLAELLKTGEKDLLSLALAMGLEPQRDFPVDWTQRGYNTILRANWHILPYEQLLQLLGWSAEKLAYVLKEDDMLFIKLGALKPACEPLCWHEPTADELTRCREIKELMACSFPGGVHAGKAPFDFSLFRPLRKPEATEKRTDEVPFFADWKIEAEAETPLLRHFIRDFQTELCGRWGRGAAGSPGIIRLRHWGESALRRESHQITIARDEIEILGSDDAAFLRAFQYLLRQLEKRGAPFLTPGVIRRITEIEHRIIYPCDVPYADPFALEAETICSDALLKQFSSDGINGIWLPALLYRLVPWSIEPELAGDWRSRIAHLQALTEKAARFGIGVYLYMCEPRCLPEDFFTRHPELKGYRLPDDFGRVATLCTSVPAVREFIRDGMSALFRKVPLLAGVFTISASENPSHCHAKYHGENCPRCSQRAPEEVIAEVNSLIAEGVRRVKPEAEVFVWSWGWRSDWEGTKPFCDWAPGIIRKLPENVRLLCTSEESFPLIYGDVTLPLRDYSISHPGPSPRTSSLWAQARRRGLAIAAKIQINNSWEISSVPYNPVMNLLDEHFRNLADAGVRSVLMSWTVGGFPATPNLRLFSRFIWSGGEKRSLLNFAEELYGGEMAHSVTAAWKMISDAFRKFPHVMSVLYHAPVHMGAANLLLYGDAMKRHSSTMITFPYNHLDGWHRPLSEETMMTHFRELSGEWEEAVKFLQQETEGREIGPDLAELLRIMEVISCHYRSTYLQSRYVQLSRDLSEQPQEEQKGALREILEILQEEKTLAIRTHRCCTADARIGFEPAQHYFFRPGDLAEKVLDCQWLITLYAEKLAELDAGKGKTEEERNFTRL